MATAISRKPYFLSIFFLLCFFHKVVHVVFSSVFVLQFGCLDVWIIASKKFLFLFSFPHLTSFFSPPYASFLHSSLVSLPCPHLPCYFTQLLHRLIMLPSSYYFITLLCFALFHCLVPSYFALPCYLAISLPSHFKYLLTPPICCFVTLLPRTLLHCASLLYTLCWLALPSSFLFNNEDFRVWRNKFSSTQREGNFFWCFVFFCLFSMSKQFFCFRFF